MLLPSIQWLSLGLSCWTVGTYGMTGVRRAELRAEVQGMFRHGYEGYMSHAYPADELRPLSCGPLHRDPDPTNFGLNDIHANVSMTLVDTLSTLPMLHPEAFPRAVQLVAERTSFDQDVKVQVFEMSIRALGGLLSTYQYLESMPEDPIQQARHLGQRGKLNVRKYRGRLLELAVDLGKRLLPAFQTPTGIPYARVNLKHGVEKGETVDTCESLSAVDVSWESLRRSEGSAGAGSLVLEFTVLSRLTGDGRFETLARTAYLAVWNRRSQNDLLGNGIGATHGQWLLPGYSGVGAGMDSYFEYGLKAAILLNDDAYLDIFQDAYSAIQTHVRSQDGFIYHPVHFRLLHLATPSTIDPLSAFLPGLQVLAGDVESAIKAHLVHWNLWRRYSASPESWDWQNRKVEWNGWPGRPEFVESTYYLYQATQDPFYLRVGERVMQDIKRRTMTSCGFATMKNVDTGELEDRMESFVLSELLKYLYLLFDTNLSLRLSNDVFSTEGQLLSLPYDLQIPASHVHRALRQGEDQYCPPYERPTIGGGLVVGIQGRPDYDYAASLVFGPSGQGIEDEMVESTGSVGICVVPQVPRHSFEILLSSANSSDPDDAPPADMSPSKEKVYRNEENGDYVIADASGLRLSVRWRLDNKGYDVTNIGPYRILPGQQVVITDPNMEQYLPVVTTSPISTHEPPELLLRFSTVDRNGPHTVFLHAIGATATFGKDFGRSRSSPFRLGGEATPLLRPEKNNEQGCKPFLPAGFTPQIPKGEPFALFLTRGGCTFLQKLLNAHLVGSAGVVVVGLPPAPSGYSPTHHEATLLEQEGEDTLIRPSAESEPDIVLRMTDSRGMVYADHRVGREVGKIMSEGKEVYVQLLSLESGDEGGRARGEMRGGSEDESCDAGDVDASKSGRHGGSKDQSGAGRVGEEQRARDRERDMLTDGRLALGEWEIWNLRVVGVGQPRPP